MARPRCAGLAVGGVGDHARGDLRADAFLGDGSTRGRSSVLPGVPGACTSLLEALVSCGFRIGDPTLFMASRLFGRPELYLPSGPILY